MEIDYGTDPRQLIIRGIVINFGNPLFGTKVTIGGQEAEIVAWYPDEIIVKIPDGAYGPVLVYNGNTNGDEVLVSHPRTLSLWNGTLTYINFMQEEWAAEQVQVTIKPEEGDAVRDNTVTEKTVCPVSILGDIGPTRGFDSTDPVHTLVNPWISRAEYTGNGGKCTYTISGSATVTDYIPALGDYEDYFIEAKGSGTMSPWWYSGMETPPPDLPSPETEPLFGMSGELDPENRVFRNCLDFSYDLSGENYTFGTLTISSSSSTGTYNYLPHFGEYCPSKTIVKNEVIPVGDGTYNVNSFEDMVLGFDMPIDDKGTIINYYITLDVPSLMFTTIMWDEAPALPGPIDLPPPVTAD